MKDIYDNNNQNLDDMFKEFDENECINEEDTPIDNEESIYSLSLDALFIHILSKGIIYRSRKSERNIYLRLFEKKEEFNEKIKLTGMQLIVDDIDGYAYLKSLTEEEFEYLVGSSKIKKPPKLLRTVSFNRDTSFTLLLLREKLIEKDNLAESGVLRMSKTQFVEMLAPYYKYDTKSNELIKITERVISILVKQKLIRECKKNRSYDGFDTEYDVEKVLIKLIDSQCVKNFYDLLKSYINNIEKENV